MLHQLYPSSITPCYVYGLLVDVGDSFGISEGDEVTGNRPHPAQPVQGVRLLQGDDNRPDERVSDLRPKLKKNSSPLTMHQNKLECLSSPTYYGLTLYLQVMQKPAQSGGS